MRPTVVYIFLVLYIKTFLQNVVNCHIIHAPPTWSDLRTKLVPTPVPPVCIDSRNADSLKANTAIPRLFRERNGWCVYSARLWLALELKGVTNYHTVLMEPRGDTYDGSKNEKEEIRPKWFGDLALPQLQLADGTGVLHCGATELSSIQLLRKLDVMFPDSKPLWPPIDDSDGKACCKVEDIAHASNAFGEAVPTDIARESSRAAWLFCKEEGYRLDALPRSTFEKFLNAAEDLLSTYGGPFFCGSSISAADVVWAPLLERYAVQLPCLHDNLTPRAGGKWPKLSAWYQAMDQIPVYACRIKGDAPSWRKVLFVDPWWPKPDLWHPRDTVGPKGELRLSEQECCQVYDGASIYPFPTNIWTEYSTSRPFVSPNGPGSEAAQIIIRNQLSIRKDAMKWFEENGYICKEEDADAALRTVVLLLSLSDCQNLSSKNAAILKSSAEEENVSLMLLYLDSRICVPRDVGAPSAATIRQLASILCKQG